MADKPIIFSAPMVRALLDGRKSQTRRVLKPQPDPGLFFGHMTYVEVRRLLICRNATGMRQDIRVPYAPGDRLWVREHWRTADAYDDLAPSQLGGEEPIIYLADDTLETWGWRNDFVPGRFRNAMHMCRWASRITMTVTDVRVPRLQEISEADAVAEGIDDRDAVCGFSELWDSLHGPGAWDANPWVAAYSFTVQRGNIDSLPTEGGAA